MSTRQDSGDRVAPKHLLPRYFDGGCVRRMHRADLRAFQAYRGIPELGRYQGWSPLSDAEATTFLAEMETAPLFAPGAWVQLAIAAPSSGELIGDIGLFLADDCRSGEIGFTLSPAAQGRGIARAAVREALEVFFAATRVGCVAGVTDARNTASICLLQRLGFVQTEVRRVVFRGEDCEERVFVLPRHGVMPHDP